MTDELKDFASTVIWCEGPADEAESKGDSDGSETTDPEISLHTMTGSSAPTKMATMAVAARFGSQVLRSLMDTGGTHNFLSTLTAVRLGLQVEAMGLLVGFASGERVACTRSCPAITFSIDGLEFRPDFLIIPLLELDVVLGGHWLETLSRVTWDYPNQTLSFMSGDTEITLTTVPAGYKPSVTAISDTGPPPTIDLLVEIFEDLFRDPTGLLLFTGVTTGYASSKERTL